MGTVWHRAPDGAIYTVPRQFTMERLPNGKVRLFHYGPGTTSLHDSLLDAYRAARAAAQRQSAMVQWLIDNVKFADEAA